jgi:nucleoside-diphosphate-sugar epimerase
MKALVTGASGFLGSHLVDECLAAGDEVRVLVRESSDLTYLRTLPGIEFALGDLTDSGALRAAADGVDVVYHSAARVTDLGSREQFWDANVLGTDRLLQAARTSGARQFVFVSSPSALMDGTDQLDLDETAPYPARFLNLYSETKAAAEQIVLAADAPGFTTCAIRPRGIWGPRDRSGFMPRLIAKMRAGKLPDLSGGKKVYASLCYCTNAARACVAAARSDRVGGKAYFVADAEKTDVWALLAEVAQRFGGHPPTKRVSPLVRDTLVGAIELLWRIPYLRAHHSPPLSRYSVALLTQSGTYDTSAAARDFGYRPAVSQEAGFAELERWIAEIGGIEEYLR